MRTIEEFLKENGITQTFLDNQIYQISTKTKFSNGNHDSTIILSGLSLTGFELTDSIIVLNLLTKMFYIQWKAQYKLREYYKYEDQKEYKMVFSIKRFDYEIKDSSGFGFWIPDKGVNLMLLVSMLSLPQYLKESSFLASNQYGPKLIRFVDDINSYIEGANFFNPNIFFLQVVQRFFGLNDLQITSQLDNIDQKEALEIFNAFIKNERKRSGS